MMMKKILIFYMLFGCSFVIFAQKNSKVSVEIDTNQIKIGEQLKLSIIADTDTLSFADFPEVTQIGTWEVVETTDVDTLQDKPFRKLKKDYFITQWDSGSIVIPQIDFKINEKIYKTDSLMLKVFDVAVDTLEQPLYDYKDIQKITLPKPSSHFDYKWLLLLLLLIPIIFFYRRRKIEKQKQKQIKTPYELAKKGMTELEKKYKAKKITFDKYYLSVTNLIKEYVESALKISAKEKLSFQLLYLLQNYKFENGKYFNKEMLNRLSEMFKRADLAKFAKLEPVATNMEADLSITNDFIDEANNNIVKILEVEKQKQRQYALKRKANRRKALMVVGIFFTFTLLIGGSAYYFLNKSGLLKLIPENIEQPEWLYSEYGGNPSIGVTTPHILNVYSQEEINNKDFDKISDFFEELSIYSDTNIVKGYGIIEVNIDVKKDYKMIVDNENAGRIYIKELLSEAGAEDIVIKQHDIENGKQILGSFIIDSSELGGKIKFEFEAKVFKSDNKFRIIFAAYVKGNEESKNMIKKVMSSVQLIN